MQAKQRDSASGGEAPVIRQFPKVLIEGDDQSTLCLGPSENEVVRCSAHVSSGPENAVPGGAKSFDSESREVFVGQYVHGDADVR